jgi:8-oxo-dGTP pyrophosphatase MutT (NUDIX family)
MAPMSDQGDTRENGISGLPTTDEMHVHYLQRALSRPLPGLEAQMLMAPAYRAEELRSRTPPQRPRQAGVLILFYPHDGQLHFPLTRRTEAVETHKGQISLPGGAQEDSERLLDTALRETCEELAACREELTVLGPLSPLYIPPSGFLIHPFVAYTHTRPSFEPDPVEVAELIDVPLPVLLDPLTEEREEWLIRGSCVDVPFFHIYGHKVWGATAMVLAELVTILHEAGA